jgi:16S rRNA (uracil1498-N3)-methyltransferase
VRVRRLACPAHLPEPAPGDVVTLDAAQTRHGLTVLRLAPGRAIELTGPWGLAPAVVEGLADFEGRKAIVAKVTGPVTAAASDGPVLALALIKGPRFDWAVEKAAELGAASLAPLIASLGAASTPGESKRERWSRLAEAARKQCGRSAPMMVAEPVSLAKFLDLEHSGPKFILDPEGGPFPDGHGGAGILLVGPEGGFDHDEREMAMEAGYSPVSLGSIRLRAETAALAALARWAPRPKG